MAQAAVAKFLPPRLTSGGRNLLGFQKTIDDTNANLENLIQACIDQLFLQTASGTYLVKLGEQDGFIMPANSGLDILSYQILVPIQISAPKQVRQTFESLIEGFYGTDKTRPSVTSTVTGPYSLADGDDLIVETESGTVSIAINANQVSDITNVSALEMASIINYSQSLVLANQVTDRTTNLDFVQLSSTSSGPSAYVRIAGGKLQNILKFPKVISTLNAAGTVWSLSRTSIYNDQLKFTWNGAGTNPAVYLAKAGDVVTIRGLVDGASPFSKLNGSYNLLDVGYDYFIVSNTGFASVSATLTQPAGNNLVFTKNDKITIYDNSEFALTSETDFNTITLTVPAVPPLARRFLQGSTHLHGIQAQVLAMTHSTIKIQVPNDFDRPVQDNLFVLSNRHRRPDFRHKFYKTVLVDTNQAQPTYTLDISDPAYATLPYTSPINLGANPVYAEVNSPDLIVTFPTAHGLEIGYAATFSGATGAQNILATDLNQELQVVRVVNDTQAVFNVKDNAGNNKSFTGISWGTADVYQYAATQANGADFYLQFASAPLAAATGITAGMRIKFDPASGTDVYPYLANYLKYKYLQVVQVSGSRIDLNAGFGPGVNGEIIASVSGFRPGSFGGSGMTEYLNTSSAVNQAALMDGLTATFIANTPSSNPLFVGAYIYDPTGKETNVTVSKFVTNLSSGVLRGANVPSVFVGSTTLADGSVFPQSGQIVIDFGTDEFEGPINYYAVISNGTTNQILIDPAYRFKNSHAAGASVQLIYATQPFVPTTDGADYPAYLTGTNNARDTLFVLAELLVASGVFVQSEVLLPDLRYEDTSVNIFG